MSEKGEVRWKQAMDLHAQAVSEFVAAVEALDPESWSSPATEKWKAAHILKHLCLAYEILLSELAGGPGMQVRTKFWQRILLRFTMVPRLLRGGAFPRGARAPRETRPGEELLPPAEAIAEFRERASRFEESVQRVHRERPGAELTHAYFGQSSLTDGVIFCARHVLHHAKQIQQLAQHTSRVRADF